jgi:hypothetical protein
MAWFTANWFWVVVFIAFIAMHMFGHGAHGGHSGHGEEDNKDEARGRAENKGSGGHQH